MFNFSKCCLPISLLLLSCLPATAEDGGKLLGAFGNAASAKTPPAGWKFSWNATGAVENPKGYAPLSYDEKSMAYGVPDESGALRSDRPGSARYLDVISTRDTDGTARFYVASYTLDADSGGDVWINNGNIHNKTFVDGTTVKIFVNDLLKFDTTFPKERAAQVFQQNLGRLKKGDAIHVAVGPGEKSANGGGKLHFTIEEYPVDQKPGPPVNILSPPIHGADPQRGADGKIDATYAAKHQAQCAQMLADDSELVFLGDSITARWPAEMLKENFGKYSPANLGIGGDRVQNVLWRIQNGVFDRTRPRVIVLLIGTNNLSRNSQFTPDEVARGVGQLVTALQEKSPQSKILVLGILPHGDSIKDQGNEQIRQANARIALLADNLKIFYLDIGDKLLEPDGSISREVMPDKLHVAAPGYTRWVDAMKPTLDKLLNE